MCNYKFPAPRTPAPRDHYKVYSSVLDILQQWSVTENRGILVVIWKTEMKRSCTVPLHVQMIHVHLLICRSVCVCCNQELVKAVSQLKLHLFIQGYTLVFIPAAMTMLVKFLAWTSLIDTIFLDG